MLIMNRQEEELVLDIACQTTAAVSYGIVTDHVFVDGVRFGRLYVWHLFSRQLYTLLPRTERMNMNTIYSQKWWTLFLRSNYHNKFILVLLRLLWCLQINIYT